MTFEHGFFFLDKAKKFMHVQSFQGIKRFSDAGSKPTEECTYKKWFTALLTAAGS